MVEIKDGVERILWNSSEAFAHSEFGGENNPDWMHVNYISYDSYRDSILLSSARADGYISIDRSGDLQWILSPRPEFTTIEMNNEEQLTFSPHSIHSTAVDEMLEDGQTR